MAMERGRMFAAAVAGSIVFAAAVPVFANQTLDSVRDGWLWEYEENGETKSLTDEEKEKTIASVGTFEGDGSISFTLRCLPTALGDEQSYGISGDLWDSTASGDAHWLSYGTNGNMWTGAAGAADITGTDTEVDFALQAGDLVTVEIRRSGSEFIVYIYKNSELLLQMTASNTNFEGPVYARVAAQYGSFEYFDAIEGDAAASYTDAQEQVQAEPQTASGSAEAATEQPSQQQETAVESASQDTDAQNTSKEAIAQTGDEGVAFFVGAAILGCGLIAFATRKRFGK